jgi:hypothetical protein
MEGKARHPVSATTAEPAARRALPYPPGWHGWRHAWWQPVQRADTKGRIATRTSRQKGRRRR